MLPLLKYFIISLCCMWNVYGYVVKNSNNLESVSEGSNEIHCYCNSASCIEHNYICKSKNSDIGCFKKFDPSTEQFLYGCLDSTIKKVNCTDILNPEVNSTSDNPLYCCYSDMCNGDISEKIFNVFHSDGIRINESSDDKINELLLLKSLEKSRSNYYTNSEIWFRALLIAVPICGLMVLLILIFIAIKMLRSDLPKEKLTSSKLMKKKYEIATINNIKSVPQPENGYRSHLLPNCDILEKKWSIVLKPSQDKNYNARKAKYSNIYKGRIPSQDDLEPRIHEKFSKQNLNILKLPYKFNEIKNKNNCAYKNVNLSNKNYSSARNADGSGVVTVDCNVNYHNYSLIDNYLSND